MPPSSRSRLLAPVARTACAAALALAGAALPDRAAAEPTAPPPVDYWCKDSGTICRKGRNSPTALFFPGFRIVAEPKVGMFFQGGNDKLEIAGGQLAASFGTEIGIYRGIIAAQAMAIGPFETEYDELSPSRGYLREGVMAVPVEWGFAVGGTLMEGAVAVGYSALRIDNRVFIDNTGPTWEGGLYLNVQAISIFRSTVSRLKDHGGYWSRGSTSEVWKAMEGDPPACPVCPGEKAPPK